MHAAAPLLSHLSSWLDNELFTATVLSSHREHTMNPVRSTQTEPDLQWSYGGWPSTSLNLRHAVCREARGSSYTKQKGLPLKNFST